MGAWKKALLVALLILLDGGSVHAADPDVFARGLAGGPVSAGLTAFVGGLLVCLTPCVYPMIAITVSVFGARQSQSRWHAMGLSTAFVLGISAMFTPLGVVAGYTGSLFGAALANPWVLALVAIVFLALAASMFGAFDFVLPSSLSNKLAEMGGVGYGGAFLVGAVSGLIAAPCTGPVLTGILLWIGKTKSASLGAAALFAFSLGLGLPFWLVGTFAVSLPKGGSWMVGVKSVFGIVLSVAAIYFLKGAVPQLSHLSFADRGFVVAAAALIAAGLALGAVHLTFEKGQTVVAIRKATGIVASVAGLFLLVAWLEAPRGKLSWEPSEEVARTRAETERRPMLVDFTAEWCGACKELSRITFSDPTVMVEARRFIAVKVDATNEDDAAIDKVKDRYRVVGLPTVVLLGSDGRERARFTEFVPPDRFLTAIRAID
ncbi:MAG TPA: cytochrome c biogenesis protein CcdA [Polyangiaceae bacterium]|jgi:thiol:disulfide interchange protein DsbD|nr:cytochrome c biogenesis protein CcdA [Polyangiaceae bacterium]